MFHEQLNSDGSVDLLCLACRALVGENLLPANLPLVREAHKCSADESRLLPLISVLKAANAFKTRGSKTTLDCTEENGPRQTTQRSTAAFPC
jgi:hypothetical protein